MKQIIRKLIQKPVVWGILPAMAVLFSACSQEEGTKTDSLHKSKARVAFSIAGVVQGGEESIEKSASQSQTQTQTLENGLQVEYTLEPEAKSKTRANVNLDTGVKYRIIVYKADDNSYVKEALFTVGNDDTMTLDAGIEYKLVAFSYNSTTEPAEVGTAATTVTVDPGNDLLYWSGNLNAEYGTNNLSMTFTHKFTQVKVIANASDMLRKITAVTATLAEGYSANLNLMDGTVADAGMAPVTMNLTWPTLPEVKDTTATSTTAFFANGINLLTVTFSSITIGVTGGATYTGKEIAFSVGTLQAGKSYKLTAKFKKADYMTIGTRTWAASNLYQQADDSYGLLPTAESANNGGRETGEYWNYGATNPRTNFSYYLALAFNWGGSGIASDPCYQGIGMAWRVPTQADLNALVASGSASGKKGATMNGRYFNADVAPHSGQDQSKYIFLPSAGNAYQTLASGGISAYNTEGRYWSGTSSGSDRSYYLYFTNATSPAILNSQPSPFSNGTNDRQDGFSLRCVK